tara:strand:- start:951 stop:1163 length:213 start_codon:yes stop_codon:yes gene_type:complete
MIADFIFSLSLVDRYILLKFKVLYKLFFILRLSCALYLAPFLCPLSCAFPCALKQNTREQVPGVKRKKAL